MQGWSVEAGVDVLEVAVDTEGFGCGGFQNQNMILSFHATGATRIGGKIYRRLAPARLLLSTGMADSGWQGSSEWPWYYAYEKLAVAGPSPWSTVVGGKPALVIGAGGDESAGFMLPDNKLYWTSVNSHQGTGEVSRKILDLETGAETAPALRVLEGMCSP
jgi:hypothetical protein